MENGGAQFNLIWKKLKVQYVRILFQAQTGPIALTDSCKAKWANTLTNNYAAPYLFGLWI